MAKNKADTYHNVSADFLLSNDFFSDDVVGYIIFVGNAVNNDVTMKGGNFSFPAIGAAVGGNVYIIIAEIKVTVYKGSAVGVVNINFITFELHTAEAKGDIALTMNFHGVDVNLSCITGDG